MPLTYVPDTTTVATPKPPTIAPDTTTVATPEDNGSEVDLRIVFGVGEHYLFDHSGLTYFALFFCSNLSSSLATYHHKIKAYSVILVCNSSAIIRDILSEFAYFCCQARGAGVDPPMKYIGSLQSNL